MRNKNERWTEDEIAWLKQHYATMKAEDIAASLDRNIRCVYAKANSLRLKRVVIKRRSHPCPWNRKYHHEDRVFDTLTNQTAYVLGFFAADGCLSARDHASHFSSNDEDILVAIAKAIGTTRPVRKYPSQSCYSLVIHSRAFYDSIADRGLTPRKSLTMTMPDVPDELFSHFLRGYFDGDGCTIISNYSLIVSFTCGSKIFLEQVRDRIYRQTDVKGGLRVMLHGNGTSFVLKCQGQTALMLSEFMYADFNNLCLERKRVVFDEYRWTRNKVVRQQWMIRSATEKICAKCKQTKPLADFGNHSSKSDGLNVYCRLCCRKHV